MAPIRPTDQTPVSPVLSYSKRIRSVFLLTSETDDSGALGLLLPPLMALGFVAAARNTGGDENQVAKPVHQKAPASRPC